MKFLAFIVEFVQTIFLILLPDQRNSRAKGDEIAQFAHVDAIAIRIPDLRCGRNHNDLFGFESGQHA